MNHVHEPCQTKTIAYGKTMSDKKWQTLWETSSYRYLCITQNQTEGHFRSLCKFQIDLSSEVLNNFHGCSGVDDGCLRRFMLVTILRCWWPIFGHRKSHQHKFEQIIWRLISHLVRVSTLFDRCRFSIGTLTLKWKNILNMFTNEVIKMTYIDLKRPFLYFDLKW